MEILHCNFLVTFKYIKKLRSRSITYINFNSIEPLECEILDFKYLKKNNF